MFVFVFTFIEIVPDGMSIDAMCAEDDVTDASLACVSFGFPISPAPDARLVPNKATKV